MSQPLQESLQTIACLTSGGEVIQYPANLRWKCVRCTNSCRDVSHRKRNILLTAKDTERIEHVTKQKATQFSIASRGCTPYERRMRKIGGRCMFLRGSRCSIYKARPLICRFYPFYLHRSEDGAFQIGFDPACSGIGKGKLLGEEFFLSLVRLARRELPSQ